MYTNIAEHARLGLEQQLYKKTKKKKKKKKKQQCLYVTWLYYKCVNVIHMRWLLTSVIIPKLESLDVLMLSRKKKLIHQYDSPTI